MTVETLTTGPTEADLEARIHTVLRKAFPWLPPESLRHQTKFAFKFGHKTIEVDGEAASRARARADILVFHNDTPLAVLELKRQGLALSTDDNDQGLSYARMLHPQPPLVVVTNGEDLILLETHGGKEWKPGTASEQTLQALIAAAGKLAAADLQYAIAVLLGPGSEIWTSAVRAATEVALADMTGRWEEFEKPFVEGFLIPREATAQTLDSVRQRKRITFVEGAPLSGKSSVLREIAQREASADDIAVLFIEADSHGGTGIVETIAGVLADAVGWTVTTDETRAWLVRMSHQSGPALVLAIDGIGAARDEVRKGIDELSGDRYGDNLRLIVAVDDTVTLQLTQSETGRKATRIGRRASVVTLDTLSRGEFEIAVGLLSERRVGIMRGGQSAPEYRVPWVLRSLVADVTTASQYADETLGVSLPPLLGPELLHRARERFGESDGIRHSYRALAGAVMHDVADSGRLPATVLESMEIFAIRRKTLRDHIDSNELNALIDRGFAKESVNEDHDTVIVARLPELLASEVALQVAHDLKERMSDPEEAVSWFVAQCARLPLGDIIGAQALFDLVTIGGTIPLNFIAAMLRIRPRVEKLKPGMKFRMRMPDTRSIDLTIREDGKVIVQGDGAHGIMDLEDFDEGDLYADMDSLMILAHLAGHPFVVEAKDGRNAARTDPMLLMEIGTAPMALRRPVQQQDMNSVITHHIEGHGSIVCHEAGIVEPITLSIYKCLRRDGAGIEDWLDEAIERKSFPLLARIDLALGLLAESGDPRTAPWAQAMLNSKIRPALKAFPQLH